MDVAISPDGKVLATAGNEGAIKLWDANTGLELASINGHDGKVKHVAYSPDGKTLASASFDWTAKLWDVSSLPSPPSPDEQRPRGPLATIRTGELVRLNSLAVSPDSKTLVAAGTPGHFLTLWDISDPTHPGRGATSRDTRTTSRRSPLPPTAGPSPPRARTGQSVAGMRPRGAGLRCSRPTLRPSPRWRSPPGNRSSPPAAAIGPTSSGTWCPGPNGRPSGLRIKSYTGSPSRPKAGSSQRHSATATASSQARCGSGRPTAQGMTALPGTLYGVEDLTFSPDGNLVAVGSGTPPNAGPVGTVHIWDTETKQLRDTISVPKWGISLAFSPDGKTLAVSQFAGRVLFYDIAARRGPEPPVGARRHEDGGNEPRHRQAPPSRHDPGHDVLP